MMALAIRSVIRETAALKRLFGERVKDFWLDIRKFS
jgi:hypothetical protein